MIREGMRNVAAGANPMVLKKGIEKAVAALVEEIKAKARKVEGKELSLKLLPYLPLMKKLVH